MSLGKKILIGVLAILLVAAAYIGYIMMTTRSHSPADSVVYDKNGVSMQIDYCRPYKKERLIFGTAEEGALLPYGKYWRLGANEATKLTLDNDVDFGGQRLEAGSYSLYAFPEDEHWVIGINSNADRWGATAPDFGQDVGRIKVPVIEEPNSLEQFTITAESAGTEAMLVMQWDRTQIRVPVKAASGQ